jgi:transposase
MTEPTACCRAHTASPAYCDNCDLLVGLEGYHVVSVARGGPGLVVTIESPPGPMGCPACGVVAVSHGRRTHEVVDTPCFGRPVRLRWRKRTWSCPERACPVGVFTEQDAQVAGPRSKVSTRATWWAVGQLRREHASVAGLARQLGVTWRTLWAWLRPKLQAMADDQDRFAGVHTLGVDEHIWHHVSTKERGPKELTGMVDLTRDAKGQVRARLLDLVPGRSGKAYATWLAERTEDFRAGVKVATLDPFHGYKNALDDKLEDAVAVLDAFHVVKLGTQVVDEVRRRVQQATTGHRGRKGDPLYRIQNTLRAGAEHLTDRQWARLNTALGAHDRHLEVSLAWQAAQKLRSVYHHSDRAAGRKVAEQILDSFHTCPIPEIARLGRTLRQWRQAFLAYFDTGGANNGGTEAINGLIELHRRIARGFRNRDNYRLRMLLIAGGLTHPNLAPPPQV